MPYVVIDTFFDLEDQKHEYRTGDEYPRSGFSVSEDRLKELSTDRNRLHKPLIELAPDKDADTSANKAELKPITAQNGETPAKPKRSRKKALKGSDNGTGSE